MDNIIDRVIMGGPNVTPKDLVEARLLLSLAASKGNAEAQSLLGWIYLVGHKVRG